jgi:chemotaxis protein methyltransferase CheR
MTDQDCILFLQWALPRLRMRWEGFRKVRGQACKRVNRRISGLELGDIASYRTYLDEHPEEWLFLDSFCRITISRFYRDKTVFQYLEREVLPRLAAMAEQESGRCVRWWSIGCASGEEPYTLAILWNAVLSSRFPGITLKIVATDADQRMIERGKEGCYAGGSLRELPADRISEAFSASGRKYCIKDNVKEYVTFIHQDVRTSVPESRFHLVLCRNSVFTYFDEALQKEMLERIAAKLLPGGALVIGIHESLPGGMKDFEVWSDRQKIFRKGAG